MQHITFSHVTLQYVWFQPHCYVCVSHFLCGATSFISPLLTPPSYLINFLLPVFLHAILAILSLSFLFRSLYHVSPSGSISILIADSQLTIVLSHAVFFFVVHPCLSLEDSLSMRPDVSPHFEPFCLRLSALIMGFNPKISLLCTQREVTCCHACDFIRCAFLVGDAGR